MCFYDQVRFSCGHWKWSHFRHHCNREYRIGETCGMKLVQSTLHQPDLCILCEKVKVKERRRQAEVDRLKRWSEGSGRPGASTDKAIDVIQELDQEISCITNELRRREIATGSLIDQGIAHQQFHSASNMPALVPIPKQKGVQKHLRIARHIRKKRHRFDLPLTFHSLDGPISVAACPDTGASENAISLELALLMGCVINRSESAEPLTFQSADGRILQSRGTITLECGFARDYHAGPNKTSVSYRVAPHLWHSGGSQIAAAFEVFDQLCDPLIIGGDFLEKTQTLSTHRHRLRQRSPSGQSDIQLVRSLGDSFRGLMCNVNSALCIAVPDTGSTADVISRRYATERNLQIRPDRTKIIFAHGEVGFSSGRVRLRIGIGDAPSPFQDDANDSAKGERLHTALEEQQTVAQLPLPEDSQLASIKPSEEKFCDVIETDCLVLDELAVNLIVGIDTLETLQAFTRHKDEFVECTTGRALNRIIEIGPVEDMIGSAMSMFTRRIGRSLGSGQEGTSTEDNRHRDQGVNHTLDDQRENARREWESNRIARLSGDERRRAEEAEHARRINYDAAVAWRTPGSGADQQVRQ